ncbi:hypothetical protein F503_00859 [Ophiostoma piceae UAMH 11346]|uniref:Uncharacterized protein n=1 Tax=Ophiostoma piceae (strain UAMH 11346) TaxID=1262450 RepID=S3C813_OPHP1|nr:hypothetical protein F503_00859 [Ophiostoma piceae UAMH 11346]
MARAAMDIPPTRMALPTSAPVATASSQDMPYSDHVMTQVAESTFVTHYARAPRWRRDITIGTLDDSLTISAPDDPAGTGAKIDSVPTATAISPVATPGTAGDASNDAPLGGDLDKITDKICKRACVPGSGEQLPVWDNYATTHNGTHLTTNHTMIYCDDKCIAHVRSITTDFNSADSEDAPAKTSVFSAAASMAASTAASAAAPAAIAGSVNLIF